MSTRPVLSLCMIVRDSSRTLTACLASVRPWVDEIIVVDTGSVDDTREVARAHGAKVFDFPWIDDFSAARNVSLAHANGEWLFWMDSDDTIDESNGRQLRELARGHHESSTLGYVMQVHCPANNGCGPAELTVVDHIKLIRNHPEIRFEGRIHEQVLPSIRRMGGDVTWSDVFVVHSGADHSPDGKKRKVERDLRILQLDLIERPEHPFVLFNLGMTYEDIGEHATAERWLRRCLAVSQASESHVRKAYAILVSCLFQQQRLDDSMAICREGLGHFPGDVELQFRCGMLAHETGQLDEAILRYRAAIRSTEPRHFSSRDSGISGHKARHNLALVYADQGNLEMAELQWRLICAELPQHRPAYQGLGQMLLRQRKFASFDAVLSRLTQLQEMEADVLWLRALKAEAKKETSDVRALLQQSLVHDSDHPHARHDLCRWLFHHATPQETAIALRELVARFPADGAAYHNLGLVYLRLDRVDDAAAAFRDSLRVRPNSPSTRLELDRVQELGGGITAKTPRN